MTNQFKKTVPGIQYLRGFAALAVLFCHYGSSLKNYTSLAEMFNYGRLGVHVFFLISGYVIALSLSKRDYHPKHFFRFLLKRSVRIEPVYLATILLTLFSFWLFTSLSLYRGKSMPFIPEQFFAHVFYIVPFTKWQFYNHVFWTLGVEFQFYILIGSVYFLNNSILFRVSFLILFALTSFIKLDNSYYLLTNYAAIFALGIAAMHFQTHKNKWYLITMLACTLIIYIHFELLILLLMFISIIFIFYVKNNIRLFNFLGEISYSLYITHSLVLIYVIGITKRIFPNVDQYELINLFIRAFIALVFAYLFYLLIEKPTIKLSKKIT